MRRATALLSTVPLLAAQTQATFYRAYEDGREAERAGQWREALADYSRAIALRPAPAARVVIYGNNLLLDYHPYARSARCHLELGEVGPAEALLARSEALGEPAALREPLARQLAALRRAAPAKEPPHPAPVEERRVQAPAPLAQAPPPPPPPARAPEPPRTDPEPERPAPRPALPDPVPPVRPAPAQAQAGPAAESAPGPRPVPDHPAPAPSPPAPFRHAGLVATGLAGAAGVAWLLWRRRRQPEQGAFQDPRRLGPYRVERLLGRGGFASTYLAHHESTGQAVALKLLHPHRHDDPEFLGRFRQEARLGALLVHPNLVRILDPGPAEGTPWLAMAYVSGRRLDEKLKAEAPLPVPEVLTIAQGVARGMAFAHDHGIVHRDLKPGNVILAPEGVKVMDFGISRIMDAEALTTTYAFLGTPLYAAPEAQLKTQVGPAADRYALGVMLFEMLAGRTPFRGETPFEILDRHRTEPLPDLGALRPDAPPDLLALVAALCRKEPEARPQDAEVLAALDALAAG